MIKDLVCLATRCSGLNALARLQNRGRLLTLCYHNVLPEEQIRDTFAYRNTVGLRTLRRHLEILAGYFEFVSGADVAAATAGAPLPPRAALLTFDDGYLGWREHAMPLLLRMGVPAVFHPCTGAVGRSTMLWYEELTWIAAGWRAAQMPLPDGSAVTVARVAAGKLLRHLNTVCKQLPDDERRGYLERLRAGDWLHPHPDDLRAFCKLDWADLRALHSAGFAIGSHTVNHPILSRLLPSALEAELGDSRRAIECELGSACDWIAYPNGGRDDVSALVCEHARQAGYKVGFTTTDAFSLPQQDPLRIGRWCVPLRVSDAAFRTFSSGIQLRAASGG